MRQFHSDMVTLPAAGVLEYGALVGCDDAILMPMALPSGPATVSIDGTLDGVNWVAIDGLQLVPLVVGSPIPLPYAGCYKAVRATVSNPATILWASRWGE